MRRPPPQSQQFYPSPALPCCLYSPCIGIRLTMPEAVKSMSDDNQFHFAKSHNLNQVSALQAQMSDFSYGKHAHEEYSFGVTLAGRQDFFANGAFHRSPPGNIIVFNPGDIHDGHSGVDDNLRYRMLYIHPDQLEPMLESAGVKQPEGFRIVDTVLNDAALREHILRMARLIGGDNQDSLREEHALYLMAERIAQLYGGYSSNRQVNKADRLLLQARDYIHEHLDQDISLDQISDSANLSKYHFLRLFREQFGITPHQYILNSRINRAREALDAGMSLDDVVYRYRFSDLSHFNRRFKPIFGMTPKQYQQHLTDR